MAASNALYAKRAQIWESMKALLAATEDRTMSGEEETAWTKMEADLDVVGRSIKIHETGDLYAGELDSADGPVVSTRREAHPATPDGPAGTAATTSALQTARSGDFAGQYAYEKAFDLYLRSGYDRLPSEHRSTLDKEFRDGLITTTDNIGGYIVPPGWLQRLTDVMKAFGGMFSVATIIDTDDGESLEWPTADDTGVSGEIIAQAAAHNIDASTPFGTRTLPTFLYSSKIIKVSLQLLQDNAFDLGSWLPKKQAIRIGRIVNNHLTAGTGTGQPAGITAASGGLSTGKTGATGQTLTVTYDDLIDLIHSVDPAYRAPGCAFMLADSSLKVVRKLKDNQGHPLWEPSLTSGSPDNLLGYDVVVNQDMPAMGANAKSIGFGDWASAYVIRRVRGASTLRLNELYAANLQVGFLGFARFGGVVDDLQAAKLYANSAT
jgi:HK97 family phage major capsid protein